MKPKLTTTKLHKYYSWQFTFWLFVLIFFTFGFTPLSSAQNQIQIIRLSLNDSISALHAGDKIQIDFRYESEQADIRIFAEPIYKGERNSGFNPFGSPLYKLESGNGTCFIGLASAGKIDSVRIYITDNTKEQKVLYEEYFKANYRFKNSAKQKRSFVKSAFSGQDTSLYIPPIPDSLIVHSYIDENGKQVNVITIASAPPVDYAMPVEVKQSGFAIEPNSVPAYRWSFGCSPTSAAMIAGYYDNHGYPNMYSGPTNGGVMPLTNQVWETVEINGYIEDQCPLSATMQGLDGRAPRGHVDDYWVGYNSEEQDPYITNGWTEHEYGDCVADYMKTNQSEFENTDGSTSFFYYSSGDRYEQSNVEDGAYGLQLFFESRGYEVVRRFTQLIQGYDGNTEGFTFSDYVQEIDAGRPVMLHVEGHSMVGYGYDLNSQLVHLHDTWDYSSHMMTWGGAYDGRNQWAVSVFELAPATVYAEVDTMVCEDSPEFAWNSHTVIPGIDSSYVDTLTSTSSLDSIVTLIVSSISGSNSLMDTIICEGTPVYNWNGISVVSTKDSVYQVTLINQKGCDSLLTLYVAIIPTIYNSETVMICENSHEFNWNIHTVMTTSDSIYVDTLLSPAGCDSVVTLNVNILPVSHIVDTMEICEGSADFVWNNQVISGSQDSTYRDTMISSTGCDSLLELRLIIDHDCQVSCPQYFHPVWEGNGVYDPMNIYIIDAKIDGVDLEPGDQIGVFDYGRCVGQGVVTQTIDQENILSIIVSADDGTGNGYTPGNQITYKIWNCSSGKEISSVVASCFTNQFVPVECSAFQSGATSFVQLNGTEKVNFVTDFQPGWNIFSMPVLPDSADIEFTFSDLILENNLFKIQDENGDALEDLGQFGGWTNNIGNIRLTEGYKVKVNEYDSLYCSGILPDYPFAIPLNPGWNLVGFPSYSYVNALEVFQQLIDRGTLIKVQNEAGKSIEDLGIYGSWQNFIGNIWAGEGFKVKLASYDTLWIDESYSKSVVTTKPEPKLLHFSKTFAGNGTDHMNFNLVELPTDVLTVGDEIAVYDEITCVGAVVITEDHLHNKLVSVPASAADDGIGPGFIEGHSYRIRIWKIATKSELDIEVEHISGPKQFTKHESVMLSFDKSALTDVKEWDEHEVLEVKCYPNPFSESVTIEIDYLKESKVTVSVMNQVGQLFKTIAEDQKINPGITRFIWNGRNENQNKVSTGIYYVHTEIADSYIIRKVVLQ